MALLAAAALGAQAADGPVGRAGLAYADAARPNGPATGPRPLNGVIWYPAAAGTKPAEWTVGPFVAGHSVAGAAVAEAPARLPLVVLSHGTGGAAASLAWLADALAGRGYLVAAVNHHGNTAAEDSYRIEAFLAWWERPRDVSVLLDRLLADPRWGPRIDPARIGVAGFSLGGTTVLALAGARFEGARWQAVCAAQPDEPVCKLPPEIASQAPGATPMSLLQGNSGLARALPRMDDDHADRRVRAALAIAPVFVPAIAPASLAALRTPVHVVAGSADDQSVAERNAAVLARALPAGAVDVLPGVGHYTFLAPCTLKGRLFVGAICKDGPGVDREAVHRRTAEAALRFFERQLAR